MQRRNATLFGTMLHAKFYTRLIVGLFPVERVFEKWQVFFVVIARLMLCIVKWGRNYTWHLY